MIRTLVIVLSTALLLVGVWPVLATEAAGGPSLHDRVDELIAAKAQGHPISPPADDADFLRRVWLDFDGGIPSAEEAKTFFTDTSPQKREALIERLIAAPRFAERMAEAFNIMLMERRGENTEWRAWLAESFKANKPWDALVREILAPDFKDAKLRGASWFMVRRLEKVGQQDTDYPGLTRDVGRMFMGVDLQCCQCHKHLTVEEYKQADFNGLFMVYQNLKLQAGGDKEKKSQMLAEGLVKAKYEFTSVLNGKKGETGPRVPFSEEVPIPSGSDSDLWVVKPDPRKKDTGVPRFSPLHELAQRLATPENPWFAKNIANRVWFLLMGRGLVEPLDLNHSANPPTHPELLELLSKELVAHQFDLKWLIRELALTKTYARSSLLPEQESPAAAQAEVPLYTTGLERHLCAEQLARTFLTATGERDCLAQKKASKENEAAKYSVSDLEKSFDAALANAAKEPELRVNPTLRSTLFFRNSEQVRWALEPHPGNLEERLGKMTDNKAIAEELFLSVLTRRPAPEESAAFVTWMDKHQADKAKALADFTWALFSSTEWFVNH